MRNGIGKLVMQIWAAYSCSRFTDIDRATQKLGPKTREFSVVQQARGIPDLEHLTELTFTRMLSAKTNIAEIGPAVQR